MSKSMSPDNRARSKTIRQIVDQHFNAKPNGNLMALTDLLASVRHFCDYNNIDFGQVDKIAYRHYLSEKTGVE